MPQHADVPVQQLSEFTDVWVFLVLLPGSIKDTQVVCVRPPSVYAKLGRANPASYSALITLLLIKSISLTFPKMSNQSIIIN